MIPLTPPWEEYDAPPPHLACVAMRYAELRFDEGLRSGPQLWMGLPGGVLTTREVPLPAAELRAHAVREACRRRAVEVCVVFEATQERVTPDGVIHVRLQADRPSHGEGWLVCYWEAALPRRPVEFRVWLAAVWEGGRSRGPFAEVPLDLPRCRGFLDVLGGVRGRIEEG